MQHLLLLHGALGANEQFINIADALKDQFQIHTLDFSGHGGKALPDQKLSIPFFAKEVLAYLNENNIKQTAIFGYSMGGYVALYFAKHHPERISAVITLAAKLHWDEATAEREVKMMNAETIELKVPKFAQQLKARHTPTGWKLLLKKCAEMLTDIGTNNTLKPGDYTGIQTKVLMLLGDRDKMVTLEETVAVYKELPHAAMGMLPYTPHPIEQVNEPLLLKMITVFLA